MAVTSAVTSAWQHEVSSAENKILAFYSQLKML